MSATLATIIGGNGFIGRALTAYLVKLGWRVYVPAKGEDLAGKSIGTVFYCAGLTADYLDYPDKTIDAHVSSLLPILQASNYEKLIYLSSTRLYDGLPELGQVDESTLLPINPHSARHFYDLTKLLGENLCHILGQGKVKVARLSCVYHQADLTGGFLPNLLSKVQSSSRGDVLYIDSSPFFERDYIHLEDVLKSLVMMATHGTYDTYNIASGINVSNGVLAEVIKKLAGISIVFKSDKVMQPLPSIRVDRMFSDLSISPMSIEDGIGLALQGVYS